MDNTVKIVLIIVIILILLVLFGCFWKKFSTCSGSSKLFGKRKCDTYCKKCGTIPCCCNNADVCNVKRDYVGPGVVTPAGPDDYLITVEGSGLTPNAITAVELKVSSTPGGIPYETQSYPNPALNKYLVYSQSGYTMTIPFTTSNDVGAAAVTGPPAQPAGPLTVGNMSPVITYSLNSTILTVNVVVPNA